MRGGSAASLGQAKAELRRVLAKAPASASQVAAELFALVDALDADKALPRALTNPTREGAPKRLLVERAMAGHLADAVELAATVSALRWSKEGDLADALEELAFDAVLFAAQSDEELGAIEAELFQVDAVLRDNRDLVAALGDSSAQPAARAKLARAVFGGAVGAPAMALIERVVTHPRGRGVRYALAWVGALVAALRNRLVASLTSARPLSASQTESLARTLAARYGRAIQLNVTVDPAVLGGLRIRVGDDVVDGSLLTRVAGLRRDLAA
ncbi:MAG: F0F1 ATP synthase subunit delta [Bifidobacteriaceae bacterium]|jgi:F-type H+-transporting ATPase subunit delta|nr:F0F1 ATP synthase subunit delta [Bifidobacteriaceae bacterium]